jgi:hypothetical protein
VDDTEGSEHGQFGKRGAVIFQSGNYWDAESGARTRQRRILAWAYALKKCFYATHASEIQTGVLTPPRFLLPRNGQKPGHQSKGAPIIAYDQDRGFHKIGSVESVAVAVVISVTISLFL